MTEQVSAESSGQTQAPAPSAGEGQSQAPNAEAPNINVSQHNDAPAATEGGAPAKEATGSAQVSDEQVKSWMDGLDPQLKDYASNKEWKDVESVVNSYKNLEKLHGVPEDRILKLPAEPDSEDWGNVYEKLGKPKSPDGYEIEPLDPDDPSMFNWAKEAFHKLNLTNDQAKNLMDSFNEYISSAENEQNEQVAKQIKQQEMDLKKDWGAAYDQNIAAAQHAARRFGVSAEAVEALESSIGYADTMKLFNSIGQSLGEAQYVGGDSPSSYNGILTPEQAKAKIQNLKADRGFVEKYTKGDVESKKILSRLHQMAYPENI